VALEGPLPSLTCGNNTHPGRYHLGVFGMVDSRIYLRQAPGVAAAAFRGGNQGGYEIDLSASPLTTSTVPRNDAGSTTTQAELFPDGYRERTPLAPDDTHAYVGNVGRTLRQGAVLGTYYSFFHHSDNVPLEKELWYIESDNDGTSWAAPTAVYAGQGAQVLVNGLPNGGNFSAPEVTTDGRTYFSTRDACNNPVMVTAAAAGADPRLAITKQFAPASVPVGGVSQLSISLQAPAGCTPVPTPAPTVVSQLAYTDALPTGLSLTGSVVSNSCGGTPAADAGASSLRLESVSLTMGQHCALVVEVRGDAVGTHSNQIAVDAVSNAENLAAAADAVAMLTVTAAGAGADGVRAVPTSGPLSLAALAALLGVATWRRRRA
jgi:hypothetical protein